MYTTKYLGWTIKVVGISHYLYSPGQYERMEDYRAYAQSMVEAKRIIKEQDRKVGGIYS